MVSFTERLSSLKGRFHADAPRRSQCTNATSLALRPQYLGHLATELKLQIASYLPSYSAAAWALCSRDFFRILADPHVTILSTSPADSEDMETRAMKSLERALILKTISRNSLDTFVCYHCLRIYNVRKGGEQDLTAEVRFERVNSGCCAYSIFEDDSISKLSDLERYGLKHLEIATKLYQHNLKIEAKKYLECASRARPELTQLARRVTGVEFWEARFIAERIYARTQHWLNLTRDHLFRLPRKRLFITICDHINPMSNEENTLSGTVSMKLRQVLEGNRSAYDPSFLRCTKCCTEVVVDLKWVSNFCSRHCLVITKWQYINIGALFGPKPQDPLDALNWSKANFWSQPWNRQIRDTFEAHTKTPFESICTVNKAWEILYDPYVRTVNLLQHWRLQDEEEEEGL